MSFRGSRDVGVGEIIGRTLLGATTAEQHWKCMGFWCWGGLRRRGDDTKRRCWASRVCEKMRASQSNSPNWWRCCAVTSHPQSRRHGADAVVHEWRDPPVPLVLRFGQPFARRSRPLCAATQARDAPATDERLERVGQQVQGCPCRRRARWAVPARGGYRWQGYAAPAC